MQNHPKEGDLYAIAQVGGRKFSLYYGYYEEKDRKSGAPVPLYPDLKKMPIYAENGCPLVTQMQVSCAHYRGPKSEDSCGHCPFFEKAELLFGKCTAPSKRKLPKTKKHDERENKH